MQQFVTRFFAIFSLLLTTQTVIAQQATINDAKALGDLKAGKGVFLVDIGDPKKLNFYLKIIQGSYKGILL